ncbi:MAG: DUF4190 domain-containing protein [Oscillospiraceae bacterium]|nr:DUF4190 domain-containing protein [Oscillospiraceae bacterium]MCL2227905.1 DUF4190 domain-containing protein [Oscillospiraceae bacterium]
MICSCGARYPDGDEACTFCGARNAEYKPPTPIEQYASTPNTEPDQQSNPWDAFPGAKPYVEQQLPPLEAFPWDEEVSEQKLREEMIRRANRSANISLVCGILGNIVAGPIFGLIAVFQGRKARRLGYPGGKATAGIVLGVFAIIFWIFVMFLFFFILPRIAPNLLPYMDQFFII